MEINSGRIKTLAESAKNLQRELIFNAQTGDFALKEPSLASKIIDFLRRYAATRWLVPLSQHQLFTQRIFLQVLTKDFSIDIAHAAFKGTMDPYNTRSYEDGVISMRTPKPLTAADTISIIENAEQQHLVQRHSYPIFLEPDPEHLFTDDETDPVFSYSFAQEAVPVPADACALEHIEETATSLIDEEAEQQALEDALSAIDQETEEENQALEAALRQMDSSPHP